MKQHEEEEEACHSIIDDELYGDDASSSSLSSSISSMHKIPCSSPRLIHTRQLPKQWMPRQNSMSKLIRLDDGGSGDD